jgi:hypothetical protein
MCTVCANGWARGSGLRCETCAGGDHAAFTVWLVLILVGLPLAYAARRWLKRCCAALGSNNDSTATPGSTKPNKLKAVQSSMRNLGKKLQVGLTVSACGREVTLRASDSLWRTMTVQLKIMLSFFQVLSQINTVYDIPYPESFVRFLKRLAFINLDLIDVMRVGCVVRVDFYDKLVAETLVPIFFSALLYAAMRFAQRTMASDKALAVRNTCIEIFLLLTFIVFPSVSTTVLRAFPCHDFDGDYGSRLKADYSIDCKAPSRPGYVVYAVLMTLVYPIGITVLYAVLLWKQRQLICPKLETEKREWQKVCGIKLLPPPTLSVANDDALLAAREKMLRDKDDETQSEFPGSHAATQNDPACVAAVERRRREKMLRSTQFLFKEYEPRFWWFEIFECARRLMLTGGTVAFLEGSATQVAVGILISLVSIQVYATTEPFINRKDDILAMTAQWGIFFTLFSGLLLKTKVPSDDGYDGALGGLLIFVNAMVIAVAVGTFIYQWTDNKDGPSAAGAADGDAETRTASSSVGSTTANPMLASTATPSDGKQLAAAKGGGKKRGTKLDSSSRDVYAATNPATQGTGDDSDQNPTAQL